MKAIYLAFCGLLIFGVGDASTFDALTLNPKCAAGPVFWCKNIQNAKTCGAMTHCIKTNSWQKYPVDSDSICQICLDMVAQARDQLRSNETQEELREVFEGTCALIRVKKIRQECDKLADEYEAQLVEMLTSQMDPHLVCSVAGLCNNAAIDAALAETPNAVVISKPEQTKSFTCKKCYKISDIIVKKFSETDRDQFLEKTLELCGRMSSFSDGCSAIVLSYYNDVYAHLKENLNRENICHMAGVCTAQFHQHEEEDDGDDDVQVVPYSQIGVVNNGNDDLPCDLCKQLVEHLRDLLVANTTETEFKNVLEGICKQTKKFKSECLSLADQYFDVIYNSLTKELNPNAACVQIDVCPKSLTKKQQQHQSPIISPLIPTKLVLEKKKLLGDDEPVYSTSEIQNFQLPKDVLLLDADQIQTHVIQRKGNQFCTLCEYFLHFVQDALASPKNEDAIKEAVLNSCHKLPKDFQGQCQSFVDMYGDAVIALLIQDLDPSQICPRLNVCIRTVPKDNEKCPLCLFLSQELVELIKKDKSKKNIEDKLKVLCSRLRDDLKAECIDFVNTYTPELVDKLANDFTPREICLYLKSCTEKEEILIEHIGSHSDYNDYVTNAVENTIYKVENEKSNAECLMCERLIKEVEKKIAKDKSRDHIKKVLEQACHTLPEAKLREKCVVTIEKDSDFIVNLLIKEVTPKEVCLVLGFCLTTNAGSDAPKVVEIIESHPDNPPCRLCQIIVKKVEDTLNNRTAQEDVENCVKHVCLTLPKKMRPKCRQFIDEYAAEIIKHFPSKSPRKLCTDACVCKPEDFEEDVSTETDIDEDKIDGSAPECILCETLVHKVEQRVRNNKSREYIKHELDEACSSFRKENLKEKCVEIVNQKSDYIIDAITKNTSPKMICHGLGFCDGENVQEDKQIKLIADRLMTKYSDTPQCVICELVMSKLENDLKKNATHDEIEHAVKKVCVAFPPKLTSKCQKFVDNYTDLIIGMLVTVPPHELCGQMNLCLANSKKDTAHNDILECGICMNAADALGAVLSRNGPRDRYIVSETTCHMLPAKYYNNCYEFMTIYVESLMNLTRNQTEISKACIEIGKCFRNGDNSMFVEIKDESIKSTESTDESNESHESEEKPKRLLGASPCTYGPSYWCSSTKAMEECNTRQYCSKRGMLP